ncbi:MAG TPA: aminotransferase class I/II-fold pyridoxal phosphate-dependent enzyme [Vicinamibacterales bacterium]|nr:aminotransferase class I/II-fold pyridoxal phosphate-dependent enzyme [Vicinamibacterales bacterium]
MRIEPFVMERMQSIWENQVEINLSESGVHPLTLDELLEDGDERESLLRLSLGYPQTNGTPALREAIAALYPGAAPANIEVTNGGSEANFVTLVTLLDQGDEMVMLTPNYMQVWGIARTLGRPVQRWWLREDGGRWRADIDDLRRLITPHTKLVAICNPDNPTGARLDAADLDAVCQAAARYGAWVLSDEIYRGAELDGSETPTLWGRYERVLVTSGLSKAYSLPGLRIGWVAGPPQFVQATWACHDYTSIAPGALNDRLATLALQPRRRAAILARTRRLLRENWSALEAWFLSQGDLFSWVPPEAGAIVMAKYNRPVGSTELTTRLREEKGVLIVPGDQFGMDGYLRIGFGGDPKALVEGLDRLREVLG